MASPGTSGMPMARLLTPAASPSAWTALRSRCSTPTAPIFCFGREKCAPPLACLRTRMPTAMSKAGAEIVISKPVVTQLRPMIRCREIGASDLDAIAALLTRGFGGRSHDYWMSGLKRQGAREVPEGYPRFGYMLDHEGMPVGVLLLLYSAREQDGETIIRCNLSSWYVEPAF